MHIDELTGEVSKLEEEVLDGTKNLVVLRNSLEKTDTDTAAAKSRAIRVAEELKKRKEETSTYEDVSIARRTPHQPADGRHQVARRRQQTAAGRLTGQRPAGDKRMVFPRRGDRRYISALRVKGKRIMVLLDTSASMMDDDVVKIIRLRNEPEAARKLAPKWRRAVDMVQWLSAQFPTTASSRCTASTSSPRRVLKDTQGKWLDSNDPRVINNMLTAVRNIVPEDGTSLVNAFIAIRTINPQPDQIILITDGLPTQGSVPPSRKFINVTETRETLRRRHENRDARPAHGRGAAADERRPARGARVLAPGAQDRRLVRHPLARLAVTDR